MTLEGQCARVLDLGEASVSLWLDIKGPREKSIGGAINEEDD